MTTAQTPMDLNSISVASPCTADWAQMQGDDKVRFCGACKLNVYNLSALTSEEAATFVGQSEGRTCIRFFRRADGTLLTQDCPEGLVAVARRARMRVRALVASAALALVAWVGQSDWAARTLSNWAPMRKLMIQMGLVPPSDTRFVIPPAWKSRRVHIDAPFRPLPSPTVHIPAPELDLKEIKGEMVAPNCKKPTPQTQPESSPPAPGSKKSGQ